MSIPPLPSNGETNWGTKFRTWADALEGRSDSLEGRADSLEGRADSLEGGKVEGTGLTLRYDNSLGTRVLLDHPGGWTMLYGDTGWRDVSNILDPNWVLDPALGYLRLRLTTHTVHLAARLNVAPDADFIGTQRGPGRRILNLPSGFMVFNTYAPLTTVTSGGAPITIQGDGPYIIQAAAGSGTWSAGNLLMFTLSASRRGAWPTVLPGTPAPA